MLKPDVEPGLSRPRSAGAQLPAFFQRPDRLADRHVDDADRHQLAGVPADRFGGAAGRGRVSPARSRPSFWVRLPASGWTGGTAIARSIMHAGAVDDPVVRAGGAGAERHVEDMGDRRCWRCFRASINAFDMPARQSFVIQMVDHREDLGNAIALNSSMVNSAQPGGTGDRGGGDRGSGRRLLLSDRRHQLHRGDHFAAVDADHRPAGAPAAAQGDASS